jgi:hypothetical protein
VADEKCDNLLHAYLCLNNFLCEPETESKQKPNHRVHPQLNQ